MEDDRISTFTLLQPELLSEKELREILISEDVPLPPVVQRLKEPMSLIDRCVSRNLTNCTKVELVELFRSIALPLPQREYGDSRREKILSKKQQKRRRISISNDTLSSTSSSFTISSSKSDVERKPNKVAEEKVAERLKPPPDKINYQRKVIRLSDSAKQRITSELDKIVIKNKQAKEAANTTISRELSHSAKRVCTDVEVNGKPEKEVKNNNVSTAAVKLKRNSLDINDQTTDDNKKEEDKPPQKKRQKIVISW